MKKSGFTLMEVLVVISVVAILVAVAIPRVKGMQDEARISRVKRELATIKAALESYFINKRVYPPQTDSITAVLKEAVPQMLDRVLYDPFGEAAISEYRYSVTADGKNYVVSSLGPDRLNGTARIISFGAASSGDDLVATSGTIMVLDTNTDINNCGEIGTICSANATCTNGSCVCNAGYTGDGITCLKANGQACGGAEECQSGNCRASLCCPSGEDNCDGVCINLFGNDVFNCGTCGYGCGTGACSAGMCVCADPAFTVCDNTCVDLNTNSTHCGQCWRNGGPDCCGGNPVDKQTDETNCGECAFHCEENLACSAGTCSNCPPGQTFCGTQCENDDLLQMLGCV